MVKITKEAINIKTTLISHTDLQSIKTAAALPYDSKQSNKLVTKVFDMGHRSIVRHGMASFLVEGISQSLLRQISRHPMLNLTVKSSRYCNMKDDGYYVPVKNINKLNNENKEAVDTEEYIDDIKKVMDIYEKWKHIEGDAKEIDIAKLFLPLASKTDLVVSGNYQALYEFLMLRNCVRAETEIRKLSSHMTRILKCNIPEIFTSLGCKGKDLGYCPETIEPCGKFPLKSE